MDHGVQYAISTGSAMIFVALIYLGYQLGCIADVLRDMRVDGLNARLSNLEVREARLLAALAEEDEEVEECSSQPSP